MITGLGKDFFYPSKEGVRLTNLFPSINDIAFADKNPDTITRNILNNYALLTGRNLAQGDPIRLIFDTVILEIIQQRNVIDFSAKMNLLAYASGDFLDHIAAFYSVYRLQAASATAPIIFTLNEPLNYNAVIPEGTRLTPNGKIIFALSEEVIIPMGQTTSAPVPAVCDTPGTSGNGFVPGQISSFIDSLNFPVKCYNSETSSNGSDTEDDEAFRERIHLAPESFSNAGSTKAYEFFALSADPNILSVAVLGPPETEPGNVNIYPLMKGGVLPDSDTLLKVLKACSADDTRPDTDYVHALAPEIITYDVNLSFWIPQSKSEQLEAITDSVTSAVYSWASWQRSALGRDINPSRLIHDVLDAGASRAVVASPAFTDIKKYQVAHASNIAVHFSDFDD